MIDLSTKTVRFVDNGVFTSFARKIAPAFKHATYWTPWASSFPKSKYLRVGEGFPEMDRIKYVLQDEDEVDLWVFFDTFHADLQEALVKRGARVWGARYGEEIELLRWEFKQHAETLGLLTPSAELVTGTTELRKELKGKEGKYVKLANGYERGDMETWKWKNEHISTPRLDERVYDLGAFQEEIEFIIEDEIKDSIEIGEDLFTIDGQFPDLAMYADEIKGLGMIGTVKPYSKMPPVLLDFNRRMVDTFKNYQYRGFFSLEGLYDKKQKYRVTDPCCRLGSPSNELLQELFTGWPMAFWEGAEGRISQLKQVAKYGFVVMVYSEQSGKHWQALDYPKEIDQWVKLRNGYQIGGNKYAVPQGDPTNIAGIVGIGNTIIEAARHCAENVKQVNGQTIEISLDAIQKSLEVIEKGQSYGIQFTNDALPSVAQLQKAIDV